jgi:polyhydroxyalkanoate synthesis regulator phasin
MTDERRPRNRKYLMLMGVLALVAVVSGGAAYAATQDDSPQARSQAIVDDAAGTLGVEPGKLSAALKKALQNQVDAQVTAGKLTQEQADAIKARIEDGTQPIFGGGPGGFGKHFRHGGAPGFGHFGGPGLAAGVEEIATYLGLEPAELRTQLASGKSLADIATAQGKTVDGLKAAINAAVTKRLDEAVAANKLTAEQKQKLIDGLSARLDDLVNGVHEERRFGGGFGHPGGGTKGDCPDKAADPDGGLPVPAEPPVPAAAAA